MAAKRSGGRKYSKGASKKVAKAMSERKKGTLTSGRGSKKSSARKVTSKKQAVAIGLSEARRAGKRAPKKTTKKSSTKKSSRKRAAS